MVIDIFITNLESMSQVNKKVHFEKSLIRRTAAGRVRVQEMFCAIDLDLVHYCNWVRGYKTWDCVLKSQFRSQRGLLWLKS